MTCPLCHQPSTWESNPWRPFCSEHCQMADLGAWATERYRIPGSTLTMDTSRPDSLEEDDDTATQQHG
ncbi:MAG: DNA gyrase inhibitor YacG [Nitrospira sp.]|nr:MAG: DNA gyrase inhibitor YacG [Nitrospira sp.]